MWLLFQKGAGKGRYINSVCVHLPSKNNASYIPGKENIISNLIRMILVLLLVTMMKSPCQRKLSFDDSLRVKYFQGKHFYFQGHLLSVAVQSYLKSQHSLTSIISGLSVKDKRRSGKIFFITHLEFRSSEKY